MMYSKVEDVFFNLIPFVSVSDHEQDNTFIHYELEKTNNDIERRRMVPVGFCLEPDYSPSSGYALVLEDMGDYGYYSWVHVPRRLVHMWMEKCGYHPDEQKRPWDNAAWDRYIKKKFCEAD